MKKLVALAIVSVITAVGATSAVAQGQILFNEFTPDVLSGGPLDGTAAGSGITATIWWGSTADPLTFVAGPSTEYPDNAGVGTGAIFGGQVGIEGTSGSQVVFLQVRSEGNGYIGEGVIAETILGGGTQPVPSIPTEVITLNLIPEPTTFALAGLGAAALLIFRRRD